MSVLDYIETREPASKRRQLLQTSKRYGSNMDVVLENSSFGRKPLPPTSCFTKTEVTPIPALKERDVERVDYIVANPEVMADHITKSMCPRLICDTGRLRALAVGPCTARFEQEAKGHLKHLCKGLTPDAKAEVVHRKYKAAAAHDVAIGGSGDALAVSFDGSGWDGSLTDPLLSVTERPALVQAFPSNRRLRRCLERSGGTIELRSVRKGCVIQITSKRRSGDVETSIGNGSGVNAPLQLEAWRYALGALWDKRFEDYLLIDGDDALILLPASLVTGRAIARYVNFMTNVGIVPDSDVYSVFAGVQHKAAAFCSSVFYIDDAQRPRTMLVLERSLKKALYSIKSASINIGQLAAATLRSRLLMSARTPIVRELLLAACMQYSHIVVTQDSVIDESILRKLGLSSVSAALSLLNSDWISHLPMYGNAEMSVLETQWRVTATDVSQCCAEIVNFFSGSALDMPALHKLMCRL
jgi:hypothetical protein